MVSIVVDPSRSVLLLFSRISGPAGNWPVATEKQPHRVTNNSPALGTLSSPSNAPKGRWFVSALRAFIFSGSGWYLKTIAVIRRQKKGICCVRWPTSVNKDTWDLVNRRTLHASDSTCIHGLCQASTITRFLHLALIKWVCRYPTKRTIERLLRKKYHCKRNLASMNWRIYNKLTPWL